MWNSYVQAAEVSQRRTAVSSKCFQLYYTCSDRLLAVALPPCSFHLFPSYSDVSQARSYFASTVHAIMIQAGIIQDLRQTERHKVNSQVLMAMSVEMTVLWCVAPCSFKSTYCPDDGDSTALWKVRQFRPHYGKIPEHSHLQRRTTPQPPKVSEFVRNIKHG
jgi:hypothetical protein